MLQRTTDAPIWPDRVDYRVVERIARDMRNQYIASLFGKAKRAAHARARTSGKTIVAMSARSPLLIPRRF